MEKLSAIRDSEVRGVLAALVDSNLVKCASRADFDKMASAVSQAVGYDYDINKIASTVDAYMNKGQTKTASMEKTASQKLAARESEVYTALGEALLMKTAGYISDDQFTKVADELMEEAAATSGLNDALDELPEDVKDVILEAVLEDAAAEAGADEAPAEA